jgi:hypothetical protein
MFAGEELLRESLQLMDWTIERGWDDWYRGLLLAYYHIGDEKYERWFEMVHDYSYSVAFLHHTSTRGCCAVEAAKQSSHIVQRSSILFVRNLSKRRAIGASQMKINFSATITKISLTMLIVVVGCTPSSNVLLRAAKSGYHAKVDQLIEKGVDVNAQDEFGWTALMWASHEGHADVARSLIDAGADLEREVENQDDILRVGGKELQKHNYRGSTALMWASHEGHPEVVKMLLEAGANVAARDKDGSTALSNASVKGNEEIVKMLLEAGSDVDARDEYGWTALMRGSDSWHDKYEIIKLLIDAGADVDARSKSGYTALALARDKEHTGIVALLEAARLEPGNARTQNRTPLLARKRYSDPNGFFKIAPPEKWRIQGYPEDPRGKVAFLGPEGAELRILAKGLDHSSFDDMLEELKETEKEIGINTNIERIELTGIQAVRRTFVLSGLKILFIDFMIGNTTHNLMYSAFPDEFQKYLSLALASFDTYEPTLRGVSPDDVKRHTIARSVRLSQLFFEQGKYSLALEYVAEGLEVEPDNATLLELKRRIE